MTATLLGLLILNLAAGLGLLAWTWRLRAALKQFEARQEQMASAPALPTELMRLAAESSPVIAIRILNPMELATQKHWAAAPLGRLTPGLLRRLVGTEASRIIAQELPKYGVVGEVRVVGGA